MKEANKEKLMKKGALDVLLEKLQTQKIEFNQNYWFNESKSVVRLTHNASYVILYDLGTEEGRKIFQADKEIVTYGKSSNNDKHKVIEIGYYMKHDYGYLFTGWVTSSN